MTANEKSQSKSLGVDSAQSSKNKEIIFFPNIFNDKKYIFQESKESIFIIISFIIVVADQYKYCPAFR